LFQATDADTELVDQLRRDADVIFSIIDADSIGSISREEMTFHLSQTGYTKEVILKIFNKMDSNQDNEISQQEFCFARCSYPSWCTLLMRDPVSKDTAANVKATKPKLRCPV
jgi:hypothetical protein